MSLKIQSFLLASIKIFPRLMTSSRWGQSIYWNETQPKPRPKRLPSMAWVVLSPIVYGFQSISFVNHHTFDCQNIYPPIYVSVCTYVHMYMTTICLKTGVLENPLPDIPETWNLGCCWLGHHLGAVQNFKSLP